MFIIYKTLQGFIFLPYLHSNAYSLKLIKVLKIGILFARMKKYFLFIFYLFSIKSIGNTIQPSITEIHGTDVLFNNHKNHRNDRNAAVLSPKEKQVLITCQFVKLIFVIL